MEICKTCLRKDKRILCNHYRRLNKGCPEHLDDKAVKLKEFTKKNQQQLNFGG